MVIGGYDENVGTFYHEMLDKQGYLYQFLREDP